jgi:regulator of sigma E protease
MTTVLAFVVTLGVLVTFHELGHYGAARWCGVKVLRFSVGFGRPWFVWRSPKTGTEWALAWIPLGGYVKMLDETEAPVAEAERSAAFNRQPLARRAFIVVAGPLANFLLAVLLYAAVAAWGTQEVKPVLGTPAVGSAAAAAGLRGGEEVLALAYDGDEYPVRSWTDIRWHVLRAATQGDALEVETRGGRVQLRLPPPPHEGFDARWFAQTGLTLPDSRAVVGQLVPGEAAERAGLRVGDWVLSVDGRPVAHALQLRELIQAQPGRTLRFEVDRQGQRIGIDVAVRAVAAPQAPTQTQGRIGAALGEPPPRVEVRHAPLDALAHGARQTWQMSVLTLRMLGRLVTGQASIKQVSGPLAIADYAGRSVDLGWVPYVLFLAVVSVSLGVLNLLPIPLLDGGRLLYYAIEFVRGRALPQRLEFAGQQLGMAVLLLIMGIALFNDISRYLLN